VTKAAFRPPSAGRAIQPSGDERQSRCLHPVRPLRARLPRGPVNDVIGMAYRSHESKVVFDSMIR
jgi:hypothetical protein